MYSDALDVNFGQQCRIVSKFQLSLGQRVEEDRPSFELLFGHELQSLIEL